MKSDITKVKLKREVCSSFSFYGVCDLFANDLKFFLNNRKEVYVGRIVV